LNISIRILVTSDDSGLIETVKNSISIHSIKKEAYIRKWNEEGAVFSLKDYYIRVSACLELVDGRDINTQFPIEMGSTRKCRL
jgi:hypothetical protein